MKASLECISCFVRQALETARLVSEDTAVHERIIRDLLHLAGEMDFAQSPPALGQRIHRRLREITGVKDPYRTIKDRHNRIAMELYSELKSRIEDASDSFTMAVQLAIAGNVIDLGAKHGSYEVDVFSSLQRALAETIVGDMEFFRKTAGGARRILYLADNAGEIVFDRLLIEQLSPERITMAVRGAPVINDATMEDAHAAGIHDIVEVIDNGSDAPGTLLEDCSRQFQHRFSQADLVIAKGQGNFETLSNERHNIFFLFKIKCPVIATHVGLPVGAHVVIHSDAR
jgi:hypothetical protein